MQRHRALCLLLAALAACGGPEPVTDADKALFLRVADLSEFGMRYPDAEAAEKFTRVKQFDGSYELTYRFESSGDQRPLYIYCSVGVARGASDAVLAEGAEKIGMLISFKRNGIEEREVPGIRAGKLALLVKGDATIGNVFTLRDGDKTYLLIMSGVYIKDAALWQKLMGPKLERLGRYSAGKT